MADKMAVLEALAKEWKSEPVREDEVTVTVILKAMRGVGSNMSKDAVRKKLNTLAEKGFLEKRKARENPSGGLSDAYSVVEGKSWEDVLQYIKKK